MLLTKLKCAIGAVMVMVALGTTGLLYRASGQSAPADKRPVSELERLRHENELLKLNLEVVLEKVRAQEAELKTLRPLAKLADAEAKQRAVLEKANAERQASVEVIAQAVARAAARKSELQMLEERANWSKRMSDREYITTAQAEADHARLRNARIIAAEDALKALREARDPESRRRAADELDKILRKLREQLSKKAGGK
jgi:hypothetical protein